MKRVVIGISLATLAFSTNALAQQQAPTAGATPQQSGGMDSTAATTGRSGASGQLEMGGHHGGGSARRERGISAVYHDPDGERRSVTIEWNPLSLITVAKLSFNVVISPVDHHAFVISPHYAWATTAPIWIYNAEAVPHQVPQQEFKDLGAELGYRYYGGRNGPRGWFIGPSLMLDGVNAKPQVGPSKTYMDIGVAADAGYQVILGDCFTISLGAGLQYLFTSTTIPAQQFPAHIIANHGLMPRALLSFGVAF